MVKMNKKMKELIEADQIVTMSPDVESLAYAIYNKTKLINNCIIFDEDNCLEEKNINFERIIKIAGDLTGYEVSCNEFQFEQNVVPKNQIILFVEKLYNLLNTKFNNEIVVIAYLTGSSLDVRFHIYREQEGLWTTDNLEEYDIPILYRI